MDEQIWTHMGIKQRIHKYRSLVTQLKIFSNDSIEPLTSHMNFINYSNPK